MPAMGGIGGGYGMEYPGNLTPFVLVTCIVAAMGGMIYGYDIGISGGVTSMDGFLRTFFPTVHGNKRGGGSTNEYCQYDSQTLTMFTSSLYLAALMSSLVASTTSRKFGRKLSMLFGGVLFFAGALLNAFAKAIWMLILGRIFLGFGIGFANQVIVAACIGAKFGVDGNPGDLPEWYAIVVVLFICIYIAGYAWSWGPLGWLVPSEIFPLEIRSAAQSLNVSVNMFFTFLVAHMFLTMLCHLKFGIFLVFAFFVCVMSVFVYYFLPETSGTPIEEKDWRCPDENRGGPISRKFRELQSINNEEQIFNGERGNFSSKLCFPRLRRSICHSSAATEMMGQVWKSHWFWSRYVE